MGVGQEKDAAEICMDLSKLLLNVVWEFVLAVNYANGRKYYNTARKHVPVNFKWDLPVFIHPARTIISQLSE